MGVGGLWSQQAMEGQPNVSWQGCLVNIPGERCKRPLTQARPAAHQAQLGRCARACSARQPSLPPASSLPPKNILVCYSRALKGPVPADGRPRQPLSHLSACGAGGWMNIMLLFEGPPATFDCNFFLYDAEQKCSQYRHISPWPCVCLREVHSCLTLCCFCNCLFSVWWIWCHNPCDKRNSTASPGWLIMQPAHLNGQVM